MKQYEADLTSGEKSYLALNQLTLVDFIMANQLNSWAALKPKWDWTQEFPNIARYYSALLASNPHFQSEYDSYSA